MTKSNTRSAPLHEELSCHLVRFGARGLSRDLALVLLVMVFCAEAAIGLLGFHEEAMGERDGRGVRPYISGCAGADQPR